MGLLRRKTGEGDRFKVVGDSNATTTYNLPPNTHNPSTNTYHPSPNSPFNYFFFLFLVFFAAILLIRTDILQAVSQTATQSNWAGGQISNTTTDFSTWTYYSNADAGVVAGGTIQLQSTGYTAV